MTTHGFDIAAFDRLFADAPIADVFKALAGYYATLTEQVRTLDQPSPTISPKLAKLFPLGECEIACDACRFVVSAVSELGTANDVESRRLLELLQASITAGAKP